MKPDLVLGFQNSFDRLCCLFWIQSTASISLRSGKWFSLLEYQAHALVDLDYNFLSKLLFFFWYSGVRSSNWFHLPACEGYTCTVYRKLDSAGQIFFPFFFFFIIAKHTLFCPGSWFSWQSTYKRSAFLGGVHPQVWRATASETLWVSVSHLLAWFQNVVT